MHTYLFLDIDGVLNTYTTEKKPECRKYAPVEVNAPWGMRTERHYPHGEGPFRKAQIEARFVQTLQTLCEFLAEAGPLHVIMSSDWRLRVQTFTWACEAMQEKGLTFPVEGQTPTLPGYTRGEEVQVFLDALEPLPCRVLILDDRTDFGPLRKYLYQTSMATGLMAGCSPDQIRKKASRVSGFYTPGSLPPVT